MRLACAVLTVAALGVDTQGLPRKIVTVRTQSGKRSMETFTLQEQPMQAKPEDALETFLEGSYTRWILLARKHIDFHAQQSHSRRWGR